MVFVHVLKKKVFPRSLRSLLLGPSATEGTHNAVQDVIVLTKLINVIGVITEQIKSPAKSIGQIIKEKDSTLVHAKNRATLDFIRLMIGVPAWVERKGESSERLHCVTSSI